MIPQQPSPRPLRPLVPQSAVAALQGGEPTLRHCQQALPAAWVARLRAEVARAHCRISSAATQLKLVLQLASAAVASGRGSIFSLHADAAAQPGAAAAAAAAGQPSLKRQNSSAVQVLAKRQFSAPEPLTGEWLVASPDRVGGSNKAPLEPETGWLCACLRCGHGEWHPVSPRCGIPDHLC